MENAIITSSSSPTGIVISMNAFINPSNQKEYLQAIEPVYKAFVTHPECLFCAVSVHPTDAGHIRVVHGWKKDSAWFHEVCLTYEDQRVGQGKGMGDKWS